MRKVFIDCGAHNGESIELWQRMTKGNEWEIFSFEPNPAKWEHLNSYEGVTLQKCAVWINDSPKDFFIGNYSEGSTLMKKKVSGKVNYNNPVTTPCIRLSTWIQDNFDKEDRVVLKLDIEGAEYAVIEDLIQTNVLTDYVKEFYGELHSTGPEGKIRSIPKEEYQNTKDKLKLIGKSMKDWHNNINN